MNNLYGTKSEGLKIEQVKTVHVISGHLIAVLTKPKLINVQSCCLKNSYLTDQKRVNQITRDYFQRFLMIVSKQIFGIKIPHLIKINLGNLCLVQNYF